MSSNKESFSLAIGIEARPDNNEITPECVGKYALMLTNAGFDKDIINGIVRPDERQLANFPVLANPGLQFEKLAQLEILGADSNS
ncbi:hypothetical protein KC950_00815 [Candidatus Saccharibacteria bacterium]|nr:hypothetical protein [Candidatus Saccharibacteria bacterium]